MVNAYDVVADQYISKGMQFKVFVENIPLDRRKKSSNPNNRK